MKITKIIQNELNDYFDNQVQVTEGYNFSQYRQIKRIALYANNIYAGGQFDSQDNYKYWYDIITPRVNAEVKNIDFDTKNIIAVSPSHRDNSGIFVINARLRTYLREEGKGVEINDAVEEGAAWGNIIWKKKTKGYEKKDLKNTFVINTAARTLNDSPVIERHVLTASRLRAKKGVWKSEVIDTILKEYSNKFFTNVPVKGTDKETQVPYYEIFERNGEISEKDLFEAQGKEKAGRKDIYFLAKITVCMGKKDFTADKRLVLFAQKIKEMPYREYHRGRYNGRWFRVGIIEMLLDIQTRANAIGNQIAVGLEAASKILIRTGDQTLAQNILTDLDNGSIIKGKDVQQLVLKIAGMDQLMADWNRLMRMADLLTNSFEIIQGESLPSGTSFKLGELLDVNATKLYKFIRQKLTLSLEAVFNDWILPELLKSLKPDDIIKLTGDAEFLDRIKLAMVEAWYRKNLIAIGPHTKEQAGVMKEAKFKELQSKKSIMVKLMKTWKDDLDPRISVTISGENVNLIAELRDLATFIQLESDPVRRTALIEIAMGKRGIDVSGLPKTPPQQIQQPANVSAKAAKQVGEGEV